MAKFEFKNPDASSYFTLELIRDSDGFYPTSSLQKTFMVEANRYNETEFNDFVVLQENDMVRSNFIWSAVIPPGTSSLEFEPSVTIPNSGSRFRGTGEFSLEFTQTSPTLTSSFSPSQMRGAGVVFGEKILTSPSSSEEIEIVAQNLDPIISQNYEYIIANQGE